MLQITTLKTQELKWFEKAEEIFPVVTWGGAPPIPECYRGCLEDIRAKYTNASIAVLPGNQQVLAEVTIGRQQLLCEEKNKGKCSNESRG
ncbi:unnamed protein product [Nippostrongylus brasiliensis]|uniref:Acetyltransferase n=1 Tax=Nippostrongylus brasiliensis TaxID=27835 RepID=A0A0N4YHM7_NIPBR|nr:unnamed protein product [Nippostrongylus brasiliensis]